MRSLAPAALLVVVLGGCASAAFSPSGSERFAPHEGAVEVLEKLPPPGRYRLVGVVRAQGVALTSDERMLEHVKALAADHGADAVVLQGPIRDRPTADGGEERTLAAYAIRRPR